jgi:hypothetical protein
MSNPRAMIIADTLATCDAKTLQLVAMYLVRNSHQKADSLEFALASEMREYLMGFGFSDKINREVVA